MASRRMRRLRINYTAFLRDYHDANETGMNVSEFCEVTGLHISTLHSRIETLAKRGMILPLLTGMRKRSKMGRRIMGTVAPVAVDTVAVELPAPPPLPLESFSFQVCVGSGL